MACPQPIGEGVKVETRRPDQGRPCCKSHYQRSTERDLCVCRPEQEESRKEVEFPRIRRLIEIVEFWRIITFW